jgi:glycosyltransferase involved in cell wall biosynthesis
MENRSNLIKDIITPSISLPIFSVIIATYNRSHLLKRALDSLIKQTESDWEAILIDDGSTDDTYASVLQYLKLNSKIKYLQVPHRGAIHSKNKGIEVSSGKYITFLDSDDEYHPQHLESRKNLLLRYPHIRFVYGGAKIIGNQYVPDKNNPSTFIHLNNCVIGGTFVIERKTLLSLKGFRRKTLGADADLYERAKKAKIPMKKCTLPTYIYHHENPDSITNRIFMKIKLLSNYIPENGVLSSH